jgi:hypothetical protein
MAATKPVDLCTQLLPTGKLCRAIAIKDERLCRAHLSTHRRIERERRHDEAMFRLYDELDAMDFHELLQTLDQKLNHIQSVVHAYPQARATLQTVIRRLNDYLKQQAPTESNEYPQS